VFVFWFRFRFRFPCFSLQQYRSFGSNYDDGSDGGGGGDGDGINNISCRFGRFNSGGCFSNLATAEIESFGRDSRFNRFDWVPLLLLLKVFGLLAVSNWFA